MRTAPLIAFVIAAALVWPGDLHAGDARRGLTLYDFHCNGCHDVSVHGREKRAATDFESLRSWVRRWSDNLGLGWSDDEVSDVTVHLNGRYYRYACPPADCKALTGIDGTRDSVALDDRSR